MRLTADLHIPFLKSSIEVYNSTATYGNEIEAEYIEPEEFTGERIAGADALIVRTRSRINKELLEGSRVRFVATATIGYDHIDTDYCHRNNVFWTSCQGCNAQAVCDYVEETLDEVYCNELEGKIIGVVGVGHVGSKVAAMAERKGMKVLLNDPPQEKKNNACMPFVSLRQIARNADIITFHTPLERGGAYPTWNLCDKAFLTQCKKNVLIINAARGGIVDEQALLMSGHRCVTDCWENEPDINRWLLDSPQTLLASYHIAGYSVEGKMNAARMCLDSLAEYFGLPPIWDEQAAKAEKALMPIGDTAAGWIGRLTEQMKAADFDFELARKNYRLR